MKIFYYCYYYLHIVGFFSERYLCTPNSFPPICSCCTVISQPWWSLQNPSPCNFFGSCLIKSTSTTTPLSYSWKPKARLNHQKTYGRINIKIMSSLQNRLMNTRMKIYRFSNFADLFLYIELYTVEWKRLFKNFNR